MITSTTSLERLTGELLKALDAEIDLLDRRRMLLGRLSAVISERDYDRLEGLLSEMEQAHEAQGGVDIRLEAVRNAFASAWGLAPTGTKLADIMDRLDPERRAEVDYRREQIVLHAETLQRENFRMAVILSETSKVNRKLMAALFPRMTSVTTYGTSGSNTWKTGDGLVDAER